jgi:hypothetical protein
MKATKQSRFAFPDRMLASLDWHRVPLLPMRRAAGMQYLTMPIMHPATGNAVIKRYPQLKADGVFLDPHPMFDWLASEATGRWAITTKVIHLMHNANRFGYTPVQIGRSLLEVAVLIEDTVDETLFRFAFGEYCRR